MMGGVDGGEEGREVGIGDEERPEEERERCEGQEEETIRESKPEPPIQKAGPSSSRSCTKQTSYRGR